MIALFCPLKPLPQGSGYWKFNSSLLDDINFVEQLKTHIEDMKNNQNRKLPDDDQNKWEYLKYDIQEIYIEFSKLKAKIRKEFKVSGKTSKLQRKYELEEILSKAMEGVRIRSSCQWYEEGEKSKKFFLNLENREGFKV